MALTFKVKNQGYSVNALNHDILETIDHRELICIMYPHTILIMES